MGTIRGYRWFTAQQDAQDYADKMGRVCGYLDDEGNPLQPGTDRYAEVQEHQGRRGLEYLVVLEDVPLWQKTGTFIDADGQERDKYENFREANQADFDNNSTIEERTRHKSREQLETEGAFDTAESEERLSPR